MTGRVPFVILGCLACAAAAGAQPQTVDGPRTEPAAAIRITSPLGRTGLVTRVRIVAQVDLPEGRTLSPVEFMVDNRPVGVRDAPPYAVEWLDETPLEQNTIVVRATDDLGRPLTDSVVLEPFEIKGRAEVTSILLETGVYDRSGRFVQQLDPASFIVKEDGVEQVVDLVAREELPTTILLIVDNSQSMSRRMDFVRLAARRLSTGIREHDRVIVAPFNQHLGVVTGPTADAGTVVDAIDAMRADGGTAIVDAAYEALDLLAGSEGRRVAVLVTDGYDENSVRPIDDVLTKAAEVQATVYVVGIGGVAGISLRGEDLLRRLAEWTGGRLFLPPSERELAKVGEDVSADAQNRYLITYTPSNQAHDGLWRAVSVEVPDGYRTRTRAGYLAPSPPPIRPAIEFSVSGLDGQLADTSIADLEVIEDGVPQQVDTFQEAVEPVSIVMALDRSGSMKPSAGQVMQTATEFVMAVRPEDRLSLITFADEPKYEHGLGVTRQYSLDAIARYVPTGGTALYDAIWSGMYTLKGVPGRRALVILTDGRDEDGPGTGPGSLHSYDEVRMLGREFGVMVFAIGLGTNLDRDVLEQLAVQSGGAAYFADDATELNSTFRQVIENLRRRYVLSYTSSNRTHDGAWRNVQIRSRTAGHVATGPGGYFAPDLP